MKAQTILRISTVLSESILLMKYETRCDRLWDFGPYGGTWAKFGF